MPCLLDSDLLIAKKIRHSSGTVDKRKSPVFHDVSPVKAWVTVPRQILPPRVCQRLSTGKEFPFQNRSTGLHLALISIDSNHSTNRHIYAFLNTSIRSDTLR